MQQIIRMKLHFCDLVENRVVIERWRQFYNRSSPHSAFDNRTSAQARQQWLDTTKLDPSLAT